MGRSSAFGPGLLLYTHNLGRRGEVVAAKKALDPRLLELARVLVK